MEALRERPWFIDKLECLKRNKRWDGYDLVHALKVGEEYYVTDGFDVYYLYLLLKEDYHTSSLPVNLANLKVNVETSGSDSMDAVVAAVARGRERTLGGYVHDGLADMKAWVEAVKDRKSLSVKSGGGRKKRGFRKTEVVDLLACLDSGGAAKGIRSWNRDTLLE